jgi:hypothetical protein
MRARVSAEAASVIVCPLHREGHGVCLGLLRGVYAALYGAEPEVPPPYSPSWAEDRGREHVGGAGDDRAVLRRQPVPPAEQQHVAGLGRVGRERHQVPGNLDPAGLVPAHRLRLPVPRDPTRSRAGFLAHPLAVGEEAGAGSGRIAGNRKA